MRASLVRAAFSPVTVPPPVRFNAQLHLRISPLVVAVRSSRLSTPYETEKPRGWETAGLRAGDCQLLRLPPQYRSYIKL